MERLTERITNIKTKEVLAYRLNHEVDRLKATIKLGQYEDIGNVEELKSLKEEVIKKTEDDFCEWKTDSWGLFPIKTSCKNSLDVNYGYKFCPYCGKKIKVIE